MLHVRRPNDVQYNADSRNALIAVTSNVFYHQNHKQTIIMSILLFKTSPRLGVCTACLILDTISQGLLERHVGVMKFCKLSGARRVGVMRTLYKACTCEWPQNSDYTAITRRANTTPSIVNSPCGRRENVVATAFFCSQELLVC